MLKTNRAILIITNKIRIVKLSDAMAKDGKILYGTPIVLPNIGVSTRRAHNDFSIVTLTKPGIYFVEGKYNLIYSCG